MAATYPDAIIQDGVITCTQTGVELPGYSGLILADCAGRKAILLTYIGTDPESERRFEFVQWGPTLSTVEINRFMKEKN
jgi:hypothetical protein